MERYFDAHLYLANWGTRRLMLRLPTRALDPATVADYCLGDSSSAWTAGRHVIVHLYRKEESDRCRERPVGPPEYPGHLGLSARS